MREKKKTTPMQFDPDSFHLAAIVRDVRKRWYWIVLTAILAGSIAYGVSALRYVPAYTTTTTFVVSEKGSSASCQNLTAAANLAAIFSKVLNSNLLRAAILEELEMPSFDGTIHASAIANTNLVTLKITAPDPNTALLVTQAVIEKHRIVSYPVLGDTILEVLQSPKLPDTPVNQPDALFHMKNAGLYTAAAMCALLAALSYLRDAVRGKREAENKLDCRVLAELCHEREYKTLGDWIRRNKTSLLITDPRASFFFVETIRKLRRGIERQMPEGVLMVTSDLENEGKSTAAVNVALAMAQKNKRVLLLDCDLRKPACCEILGCPWTGVGTVDVAARKASLEEAALQTDQNGLYILPERRSVPNSAVVSGSKGMAALIQNARERFDYVVIDTPAMASAPDAEWVMELADAALLVVRQNAATADQINQAAAALKRGHAKLIGCVINNVYRRPGAYGQYERRCNARKSDRQGGEGL